MKENYLLNIVDTLKEILKPFKNQINLKFKEDIDLSKEILFLWSNLSEKQFSDCFKDCMDKSNFNIVCELLEEIHNWKIIDNQYKPAHGLDLKNTMDLALRNLIQFLDNEEILDICTGFFRPNVWELVSEDFQKLYGMRILIGAEYEIPKDTTDRIQRVFQDLLRNKNQEVSENTEELYDHDLSHLEKSSIIHRITIEATSIDNWVLTTSILELLKFLKKDTVDVRLQKPPFQHGKLYISDNMAYLGSSNFTRSGLISNTELNIQIQEKRLIKRLKNWYNERFEEGVPYKEELIQLIERSKFGNYPYTPFEVYMKIAFEQYKNDFLKIIEEGRIQLAQFQAEGASKALGAIKKFGGVMIADAVGLGKTFTAMAILENLKFHRGLVICPAQLRNKWEKFMEDFPACRVYSMELPKHNQDSIESTHMRSISYTDVVYRVSNPRKFSSKKNNSQKFSS